MFSMVDLKISNLRSVIHAFERVGVPVHMVSAPSDVAEASAVILPGVGAYGDGMQSLREQGLVEPLRRHAQQGKPLIGICLGMQLLAQESEEYGSNKGLGLIEGRVERLDAHGTDLRVPNMGWCDIKVTNTESRLFGDFKSDNPAFYFAHSYHLSCEVPADVVATLDYGKPVTAAIERNNIFGIQFHPENSQSNGLNLLATFCSHIQNGL